MKEYPGVAVETVSDSSRYFVLRIQDDNGEDVDDTKTTPNRYLLLVRTTPKPFITLA